MVIRLKRALRHVRQGTAVERLKWGWDQVIVGRRRRWWDSQRNRRQSTRVTLQHGVRMLLYFDSVLCRFIYCRTFEQDELDFVGAFLRPGDVFVDVGANIGLFTLTAAHRVGKRGHVFAFEPCGRTHRRLAENVNLNRFCNVKCQQMALSDAAGVATMAVALDGHDAWNSLTQPCCDGSFTSEEVTCTTWDSFASEHGLIGRVTLIKIDVEGWESHVLAGGRRALSRDDAPVLLVEFTEPLCRNAGTSSNELYRRLEELGYRMFTYNPSTRALVPEACRAEYPHLNLIATKHPEEVMSRLRAFGRRPRGRSGGLLM